MSIVDGVAQPLVSFLALGAWTFVVARSRDRSVVATVVWAVAAVYAFQSLSYVDLIGGDVAKTVAFCVRLALLFGAFLVIGRHRR